jgi:diguanylate cyclase (GGDEF)-like protein
MTQRAWVYIGTIVLGGVLLGGQALWQAQPLVEDWLTFGVLTVLATLAQLFKATAPPRTTQSYSVFPVFLFAGVLLLPPAPFVLLVVISQSLEWLKERALGTKHLLKWYIQPFNIAMYIIAGFSAHIWLVALNPLPGPLLTTRAVLAVTGAAVCYVVLNHLMIGSALVLARGIPWRQSGVMALENLVTDFVMLCLGAVVGVLWPLNLWLVPFALSPLVLIYRALWIPHLKEEAHTDGKTGLLNARRFNACFAEELARALRFGRPLAVIMADLDFLRNINNTYGHLAGDVVLTGIGQIIRETVRDYDLAGRFGGEEFAIVLPETDALQAAVIAERIRQAVEAARFEVTTSETAIQVTMSLGVAAFPDHAASLNDLIQQADLAVYQAKATGRNRVVAASELASNRMPEQAGIPAAGMVELGWQGPVREVLPSPQL